MKKNLTMWVMLLAAAVAFSACDNKKKAKTKEPSKKAAKADKKAKKDKVAKADKAKAEPARDAAADKILDAAIAARGGLDKIKAVKYVTGKTKGNWMGMPYTSEYYYLPGEKMRMDVAMPSGETMSMLFGMKDCWNKSGPVVTPCKAEHKASNRKSMIFDKAMILWPLKEKGWVLKAGKVKEGDKELDSLHVKSAELNIEGTLTFDPKTHELLSARYNNTMMGKAGEMIHTIDGYKDMCGIKMPAKVATTFGGKPMMNEEHLEITCDPIDDKIFAQPEQVKDGTFVEKEVPAGTQACYTMKGPYENTGLAFGKLMGFMAEKKLVPMGPPIMIYLAAAPKVKDPKKFVTEVCFPVGVPAPKKPEKKGDFAVRGVKAMQVLSAYGIGSYETKSPELAKLLVEEAKKRKLKISGPLGQITFMEPGQTPPEQYVSEMQLPIKVKKGKKGKKRGKK
jgi:effector-binding domain-containing protein